MLKAISIIAGIVVVLTATAAFVLFPKSPSPSITGHVWYNRADGESIIQRGVMVYLVSPRVSAPQIMQAAQSKLDEIKRRADGASDHAGIREDANALKAEILKVQQPIPIDDAIAILNGPKFEKYGRTVTDDFVGPATVATRETDVNGIYEFKGIKPGDYMLVAHLGGGGSVYRDVTVGEKPVTVDLH